MDKNEAYKIINRFSSNDNPTEKDEFVFIETANFLIETENDCKIMSYLGGYYYEKQKYDLAEKYYLMADENGDDYASCGLGFIYYYGRNGAKDFKKAFYYYNKSMTQFGNMESSMKIADMYHNGYGCERDDQKYKEILESIFLKIKDTKDLFQPYPEVAHRLAEIYINDGKGETTREMLTKAKSFICQRIRYNPFWGNFIVCRRVIDMYYKVYNFEEKNLVMNFFDLFYLFKKQKTVKVLYFGNEHIIESFFDEGQMRVKCDDTYYKSTEDFLMKAKFNNKHVYIIDYDFDYYTLTVIK